MQSFPELPPSPPSPDPEYTAAGQIPPLEPYLAQLVLAQAAELARSGHYQEAEELISGLHGGKDQPFALDLLARMRAQQGRWLEAEVYWKQALQQDPTNPAYLEGLQYIQRARRPPTLSRLFSPTLILGIIALVLLLLAAQGVQRLISLENDLQAVSSEVGSLQAGLSQPQAGVIAGNGSGLPTQVIPTFPVADLAALRQEIQDNSRLNQAGLESLQKQMSELQTSQADLVTSLQPPPTAGLEMNLAIPGAQLLAYEDGWMIQFEEGLFPYGWALSQEGRQILDEVSLQIKPYLGENEVSILGFKSSDELDEYFDLGLMRAVVVLDYLESSGELPMDQFKIQPQSNLPPPFSNDTIANRARNRTVILLIHPKAP